MTEAAGPTEVNEDIESRADVDNKPLSARFWLGEISASKKRDQSWWKRGAAVVKQYRDERDRDASDERRANILWSNVEILKGALFQGMANPDVRRRFPKKGKNEKAARTAAIVLERGLSACQDMYNAASSIECALEDCLLPGRGVCWVVYEADVEPQPAAEGEPPGPPVITQQTVRVDHVYWQDYLTSAGRKEQDIWWKARLHLYSRDEVKQYFPEHGEKIPLNAELETDSERREANDDTFKRAKVWEIWDKVKKQRIYVAEDYEFLLKQPDDDPYRLQGFFPAPEPLYSVKTTSSLIPVPEYTMYQDQAMELNDITQRLSVMIEALKRRGVYDGTSDGGENQLAKLMRAGDNEFIPYKGFAALMEKGGLKNVFQTEDLGPILQVVQGLYEQRAQLIQTIYEITGISDVLRGASNPNETATAQRLKGQFGSLRLQKRQSRVNEFIRDVYRIKAEIIAEHFTREKLIEMTGTDMPMAAEIEQARALLEQIQTAQPGQAPGMQVPMPAPQAIAEAERIAKLVPWEEVESILRSDERRSYKIDIETDSTARSDDLEQKKARVEFLTAVQGFLGEALPPAMAEPKLMPLVRELTLFGVKAFKIGRGLEDAFEDAFDGLQQTAEVQSKQGPPEDPKLAAEAEKIKHDMQMSEQKGMAELEKMQRELAMREEETKAGFAAKQKEFEFKEREIALREKEIESKAALEWKKMHEARTMEEQKARSAAELKSRELDHASEIEERRIAFQRDTNEQANGSKRSVTREAKIGAIVQSMQDAVAAQSQKTDQVMAALSQVVAAIAEQAQQTQHVAEVNAQLIAAMNAPRKVVRDKANRIVGVQVDGQPMRKVVRDKASNRIVGVQVDGSQP